MVNFSYIFLAYASLFILGFTDNARGPFYPEFLTSFGILENSGSLIFSLASLSSFVCTLFGNWWRSLLGLVSATRLFLFLQFIAVVIFAVSGWYQSFALMLVGSIFFGLAVGGLGICNNLLVAKGSDPLRSRQYFSGLHAMYGLASIISPFLIGMALTYGVSWPNFFLGVAVVSLVPLIGAIRVQGEPTLAVQKSPELKASKELSWLVAICFGMYVSAEVLISSRLVIYLQTAQGFSKVESANYLMYFFVMLLAGRLFVSLKTLMISNQKLLVISACVSLCFIFLGIYLNPLFLCLTGLSMSYFYPCLVSYLSAKFPELLEDLMTKLMIGVGVNLFVMHWLFGAISTALCIEVAMHLPFLYLALVLFSLKRIITYKPNVIFT
jgi:fucose permease